MRAFSSRSKAARVALFAASETGSRSAIFLLTSLRIRRCLRHQDEVRGGARALPLPRVRLDRRGHHGGVAANRALAAAGRHMSAPSSTPSWPAAEDRAPWAGSPLWSTGFAATRRRRPPPAPGVAELEGLDVVEVHGAPVGRPEKSIPGRRTGVQPCKSSQSLTLAAGKQISAKISFARTRLPNSDQLLVLHSLVSCLDFDAAAGCGSASLTDGRCEALQGLARPTCRRTRALVLPKKPVNLVFALETWLEGTHQH